MTTMKPAGKLRSRFQRQAERYCELSRLIIREATRGAPLPDFLTTVATLFREFARCDQVTLRLRGGNIALRASSTPVGNHFQTESVSLPADHPLELARAIQRGDTPPVQGYSRAGALRLTDDSPVRAQIRAWPGDFPTEFPVVLLLPFEINAEHDGTLLLFAQQPNHYPEDDLPFWEGVAQSLGAAVDDSQAQHRLRERVKELSCLYRLTHLLADKDLERRGTLSDVVALLPPAWQWPDLTMARIQLDDEEFTTPGYHPSPLVQRADIVVSDKVRGFIEVAYREEPPAGEDGPFLEEEQLLINDIAGKISAWLHQHDSELERATLTGQLRHADRLATIGQLAAGVGHELNEPLAGILGFTELALKDKQMADSTRQDLMRVIQATMHAREIIRQLMLFARPSAGTPSHYHLTDVVRESLTLLHEKLRRNVIELDIRLPGKIPRLFGDPGHIRQVIINLAVNAIQAMSGGGILKIHVRRSQGQQQLIVEDSGVGMTPDILSRIFLPFFTTKEQDQGTGLGLSVVHGIIAGHGGRIDVTSTPGEGTRFVITLSEGEGKVNHDDNL